MSETCRPVGARGNNPHDKEFWVEKIRGEQKDARPIRQASITWQIVT